MVYLLYNHLVMSILTVSNYLLLTNNMKLFSNFQNLIGFKQTIIKISNNGEV